MQPSAKARALEIDPEQSASIRGVEGPLEQSNEQGMSGLFERSFESGFALPQDQD